jgi:Holliday junction resolvase RusA-like endonuclease
MERQNIITIELAGEPIAKGRARFVRSTGIAFTPARTRTYESHLRLAAQEAMDGRVPFSGPLLMRVRVTLPIPASFSKRKRVAALEGVERPAKRPDWDNYGKIAADALNMIVFNDDSQIVDARVVKQYGERPGMQIDVGPV